MALFKKEVLVRPNSSANFTQAMEFSINWLTDTFQEKADNKDEDNNYIDYFFADVFFANGHATNSGQLWRIYSTPCGSKYTMTPAETGRLEFMINDLVGTQTAIQENSNNLATLTTEVSNELEDHDERITALENENAEVEAVVI